MVKKKRCLADSLARQFKAAFSFTLIRPKDIRKVWGFYCALVCETRSARMVEEFTVVSLPIHRSRKEFLLS